MKPRRVRSDPIDGYTSQSRSVRSNDIQESREEDVLTVWRPHGQLPECPRDSALSRAVGVPHVDRMGRANVSGGEAVLGVRERTVVADQDAGSIRFMQTMLAYSSARWCCPVRGQDLPCPVQEVLDRGLRDPMQEAPVENPSE